MLLASTILARADEPPDMTAQCSAPVRRLPARSSIRSTTASKLYSTYSFTQVSFEIVEYELSMTASPTTPSDSMAASSVAPCSKACVYFAGSGLSSSDDLRSALTRTHALTAMAILMGKKVKQ